MMSSLIYPKFMVFFFCAQIVAKDAVEAHEQHCHQGQLEEWAGQTDEDWRRNERKTQAAENGDRKIEQHDKPCGGELGA